MTWHLHIKFIFNCCSSKEKSTKLTLSAFPYQKKYPNEYVGFNGIFLIKLTNFLNAFFVLVSKCQRCAAETTANVKLKNKSQFLSVYWNIKYLINFSFNIPEFNYLHNNLQIQLHKKSLKKCPAEKYKNKVAFRAYFRKIISWNFV